MADARRADSYNYDQNTSTEYRRFASDYFSGSDIRIYFGDIWVDEITSLQFSMQENVAPIYGYASYTWDKVARGTRQIQGSFNINFKESYYLHSVMNSLSSKMNNATKSNPIFSTTQWDKNVTIEQLMASTGGNFDVMAETFEKSLWGSSNNASMTSATDKRGDSSYFSRTGANGGESNRRLAEYGFNILISYGESPASSSATFTGHTLVGVQLTGVSQIIGNDGRPLEEQYTFIAKDLDGNMKNYA